jgi:hypothetical protein
VAVAVAVGLGVGVGVAAGGVGVGVASCATQYFPPVVRKIQGAVLFPPHTIISSPVQTAV